MIPTTVRSLVVTLLLIVAFLCLPMKAHAQIAGLVLSPTQIVFDPSTDNNATLPLSGTPIVSGYTAYYFLNSIATPTKGQESLTVLLGKPTVDPVTGKMTAINVFGGLVPNTAYKAVIVATGPGGESVFSNVSVPFGKEAPVVPSKVGGTPVPK